MLSLLLVNFDLIILLCRIDLLVNDCPFFLVYLLLLFLIGGLEILILIHQLLHSLLMCLLLLLFS